MMISGRFFRVLLALLLSTLVSEVRPAVRLAPGAKPVREFNIIPAESSFWVFVGKAGLFSVLAHDHNIGIRNFTGKVTIPNDPDGVKGPGGKVTDSGLEMKIDTRSLTLLDDKISDGDRAKITRSMHEVVLESARYPEAAFRSAGVTGVDGRGDGRFNLQLSGDLTLHGVTRRITIPVSLQLTSGQLKASGKYTLRQSDFGIQPYSTAGGTIRVRNDVVVSFEIVARQ